jgi:hypothetical protein
MTTPAPDQAAAHIAQAKKFADQAETWADADYGWMATMSTEERIQRRANDLAAAQVHATLATALHPAAAGTKPLVTALLTLVSGWYDLAAEAKARANRLGNCAAGKEAFGDSVMLRSCAEQLTAAISTAIAGEDRSDCNTFTGHHS